MRTIVTMPAVRRLGFVLLSVVVFGCLNAQSLYVATGSNGVPSTLYSVNPANGLSTSIGNVTIGGSAVGITGLAFHPSTNVLYGVTTNHATSTLITNKNCLVTIDPANASATLVGSLGR